jgi:hypothetical protein
MRPAPPTQRARHRGNAHLLAMRFLPPSAVLFQGSIEVGCELSTECLFLLWANMTLCARHGLGGQGATLAQLLEVPLD